MNYILNTKTKKVEIFWDNQNEYQALINFISNFSITEEQNPYIIKTPEFGNPSITWATNNLPNSVIIGGNDIALGTITCSNEIDTTVASLTSNITKDDIVNALKSEPKEQYWLNGNPINSIQQKTE